MTVKTTFGLCSIACQAGLGLARWTRRWLPSQVKWVGTTMGGWPGRPLTLSCPKSWPSVIQVCQSASSRPASQGWTSMLFSLVVRACSGQGEEADGDGGGAEAGELGAVHAFGEHATGEQDGAGRVEGGDDGDDREVPA